MYIDHAALITQSGGWLIIGLGRMLLTDSIDFLRNLLPQIPTNGKL
jgi:hypothetical protein